MQNTIDSVFLATGYEMQRESPIPLYHQISEAIIKIIEKENLQAGTRIPSETRLGEIYSVSKMTLRQAIAKLVADGVLERRHGAGTFVAEKKIERKASKIISFNEEVQKMGLTPSSKILEAKIIQCGIHWGAIFNLARQDSIFKVIRLWFADGTPLAINSAFIPAKLCPNLLSNELNQVSLAQLLEDNYGIHVEHANQKIQATNATNYESSLLGIKENAALLLMEQTMFNSGRTPVTYYANTFRADKYVFSFTLDSIPIVL